MSNPLISIVLCTYNGEKFLEEQVNSLLQQSYKNIEIIISDDASSDNTVAILERYRRNPAVKLFFHKENIGPTKNFEFAARETQGQYIAFCDQDDVWLPEKMQSMYDAIGDHYLIYSDSELVNEQGESLHKTISDLRRMYSGKETTGFVFSNVVWGHALMIKREFLVQALPIPANIAHDGWMGFLAATLTGIKYLDIPLTKYRQHADTATKTIAVKAEPRSNVKRYRDFEEKLYWIGVMRDHERKEWQPFYSRLYDLYKSKEKGRFSWKLFFFLLQHRRSFFMFTRKKWLSQIIEIRKQSRGEYLD